MVIDASGVGVLVAILAFGLAIIVQHGWPLHDCGNRYCRHVRRDEDAEQDL